MNGKVERLGQTILNRVYALLIESKLPKSILLELVNTANYLRNRSPVNGIDKTPHEEGGASIPDLSHLRRIRQKGLYEM